MRLTDEKRAVLKGMYYDTGRGPGALQSATRLFYAARKADNSISLTVTSTFFQNTFQEHHEDTNEEILVKAVLATKHAWSA